MTNSQSQPAFLFSVKALHGLVLTLSSSGIGQENTHYGLRFAQRFHQHCVLFMGYAMPMSFFRVGGHQGFISSPFHS